MTFIFNLLIFVFVIGIMILVHEWGHYFAARKIGVEVEAFSIGFGPQLIGWTRGKTKFKLSLFPIGGYVKMKAENPDEGATGDPGEFMSRKRWERFIILIMGPLLNILFAFLIWMGIIMLGEEKQTWLMQPPVVEYVDPGGPARKAGITAGDTISAINGEKMNTWEQLIYAVSTSPREELILTVNTNGQERNLILIPQEDDRTGIGSIGVGPSYPPIVHGVVPGSPADRAGLQNGDRYISINGIESRSYYDLFYEVREETRRGYFLRSVLAFDGLAAAIGLLQDQSQTIDMVLSRQGEEYSVSLPVELDPSVGFKRIGVSIPPMPTTTISVDPLRAIYLAGERCVDMTVRLYEVIGKMISGKLSTKALSGPVEIATISGRTAEQGLLPLLNLMAFISLNLGIANLLPIPVLDGGHITIIIIEGLFRRDLNKKVKEWVMRFGMFLLLSLMFLIIVQDIIKNI